MGLQQLHKELHADTWWRHVWDVKLAALVLLLASGCYGCPGFGAGKGIRYVHAEIKIPPSVCATACAQMPGTRGFYLDVQGQCYCVIGPLTLEVAEETRARPPITASR